MDSNSDNIEPFFSRYQIGLETSMKRSYFIFDCLHFLRYKCHEINLNCGGSYVDKKQKKPINPVNDDDKSFLYGSTIALNQEKMEHIQKEYQKSKSKLS